VTRTAGILVIALFISLALNLGQWEKSRRTGRHRYEFHTLGDRPTVFDPSSGDLFTVAGTNIVRINLPKREVKTLPEIIRP